MIASEFTYLEDFLTKDSLIVAFSQSGETIDVIEPLNHAKKKGSTVIALTNSIGSTIYRLADEKILLGAGPERAVASTKAYIAKVAILLLLSYAMIDKIEVAQQQLRDASKEITRLLGLASIKNIKKIAKYVSTKEHMYTIGRGISYATALEAALKIKEVSYIHTEGLAGGELKHGTIALITKGTPCIVFAPNDETYDSIISNAIEIKSRGGYIIGIGPRTHSAFDAFLKTADLGSSTIIPQVVVSQLLAYYTALACHITDPDKPRNLAKSVTVK
jgi:glucosamine--fructose-6-phosphate aminotransferase (isomerizing)